MNFSNRIPKVLCLFFCLLNCSEIALAQNLSEWFKQNKTQNKYLIDQILANQLSLELLKNGYQIVRTGMQSIEAIKQNAFSLHQLYFQRLKEVNPVVQQYSPVVDVIAFQWRIMQELQAFKKHTLFHFSLDQQHCFLRVSGRLVHHCAELLQDLHACLEDQLQMSTSQRIARINAIYEQMLDNRRFSLIFFNQVRFLDLDSRKQRLQEQQLAHLLSIEFEER